LCQSQCSNFRAALIRRDDAHEPEKHSRYFAFHGNTEPATFNGYFKYRHCDSVGSMDFSPKLIARRE
jgi:hypothetical protein